MLNVPAKPNTTADALIPRRGPGGSITRCRPVHAGIPPQYAEAFRTGTMSGEWFDLGCPESTAAERSARRASVEPDGLSSLLEPKKNNVTQSSQDRVIYLCPTGCGRSCCPNCSYKIGMEIRKNLLARVRQIAIDERWGFDVNGKPKVHINMWTFTCDPKLGLDSEELYDRESSRKYIAKIAQRFGWKYWVASVEWQKSGMPHWHVLHLGRDKNDVYTDWNQVSAAWPLGNVLFSTTNTSKSGGKAENAIFYVTKYMTKGPDEEHEAPEWVMNRAGLRMVRASRAVGAIRRKRQGPERGSRLSPDSEESATIRQNNRQALADCGSTVTVLIESVQPSTGAVVYQFKTLADVSWDLCKRWSKNRAKNRADWEANGRRVRIPIGDESELTWLLLKTADGPPKPDPEMDPNMLTGPGISPTM